MQSTFPDFADPTGPLPPILPVGTAVVVLASGATGVIVASPLDVDHSYRVRFPGGEESSFKCAELEVLSRFQWRQDGDMATAEPAPDFRRFVIYRCVIGSRAYGLDRDESDTDRRGIYLPPASMHWSVFGVPEQLEDHATQECYWEYEKFIRLALKANPNVLEVLYSPMVEHVDPLAQPLLAQRAILLSRLVYQTFNGYALSQFAKIEQDVRNYGRIRWKHAMHLIRLLRAGISALRIGELPVRVETGRDELLDIRDGRVPWDRVDALRKSLHVEFESAFRESRLPERPDYRNADELLIAARAAMARREFAK